MAYLFSGTDASGNLGLWLTTGPASSTVELTLIAAADATGVFTFIGNPDITRVSNAFDVFEGLNSVGHYGLWVTNGTASDTEEITGITGANANGIFNGISDPYFTDVINVGGGGGYETLFAGVDTSNLVDLWALIPGAGVEKLSVMGVSAATGLAPYDMTNFGSYVIFAGTDSSDDVNLWLTNGTGAGTSEITGVVGAEASGLHPEDITTFYSSAFGYYALFEGYDSGDRAGLWVTTGTGANTHELLPISGTDTANGIFVGISNPDFTQFGSDILFFGSDSADGLDLWQTNLTSAGTTVLKSFGGDSDNVASMIVFGNQVIFSEGWNLWAYNGSTFTELAANIFDDGASGIKPDFTLVNGFIEFAGMSAGPGSDRVLYETNGVTTAQVTPIGNTDANGLFYEQDVDGSTPSFGLAKIDAPADFTGNGTSDITIGYDGGPVAGEWLIQNAAYASGAATTLPTGWSVVGTGDFTGDGIADLLIQSGSLVGDVVQSGAGAGAHGLVTLPTGWNLIGTGDFNGDGTTDLLIQSGEALDDFLIGINGVGATGVSIATLPTGWNIIGTGDFIGDGTTDLLLQSGNTLGTWLIGNGTLVGWNVLGSLPPGWNVVGTGDFNGDGTSDLLLEDGSGDLDDWTIKDAQVQASFSIGALPAGWNVVGTGDYNGDGTSDLLLQSGSNMMIWTMQNGAATHALGLPTLPAGWTPIMNPTGLVA
jgi:hypothetical protein